LNARYSFHQSWEYPNQKSFHAFREGHFRLTLTSLPQKERSPPDLHLKIFSHDLKHRLLNYFDPQAIKSTKNSNFFDQTFFMVVFAQAGEGAAAMKRELRPR
jgi:hypothetical protein